MVSETSCLKAPWVYQIALGNPVWIWAVFLHLLPTRNGAISASHHIYGLSLQWANKTGQGSFDSVSDPFSLGPKSSGTGDFQEFPFPLVGPGGQAGWEPGFILSRSSGLGLQVTKKGHRWEAMFPSQFRPGPVWTEQVMQHPNWDLSIMKRGATDNYMELPEQTRMCSPYPRGHPHWEGPSEEEPLKHS